MEACITVIVPVHNTKNFLRECLDSILGQSYQEMEVICVDSSTDGTTAILKEYEERDGRIIYVKDANNSYGYKINVGIKNAKGEYIAIVDSDDYIETSALEEMYRIAKEQEADFVKADHMRFRVENGTNVMLQNIHNAYRPYFYGETFSIQERPEIVCLSNPAIWTGLYRKDFLIDNRIYLHESEGASYQDAGFSVLTHVLADRIYYSEKSFYRYRTDNDDSSVKAQNKYRTVVEECAWIEKQLTERGISKQEIWNVINIRKINTYFWNYERLEETVRRKFCAEIHEELEKDFEAAKKDENWRPITEQRWKTLFAAGLQE